LLFSVLLQQFLGQAAVAQERLETQLALCTEHGFVHYLGWGTLMAGWSLAVQGQVVEGIAQMRQGLVTWRATGSRGVGPWMLALLAESRGKVGQVEEGLHALREALELMQTTQDRVYEAEVYRLQGELLLQQSAAQQEEAVACFQQALAVARRQQAKALELRATMSLARLWQQQGKRDEARELLAPIYGWFTEGFDTADLQEAKVLLDELS
jgi:predicted ATPase